MQNIQASLVMDPIEQDDKHSISIQRLATSIFKNEVLPLLQKASKEVAKYLRGLDKIPNSKTALNRLTSDIKKIVEEYYSPAWVAATLELDEFALYEAGFYAALMSEVADVALKTPADEKIARYISKSIMSLEGNSPRTGVWSDFVSNNVDATAVAFAERVKSSFRSSRTINETVKDLDTLSKGASRRSAENLVRTGLHHYAIQARLAMADDNRDIIEREVPIVTFDNRISGTCITIGSKYGQKGWERGKSPIGYPPYHYGCRTGIIFLPKGQETLEGMRASVSGRKGKEAREAYEARESRTDKKVKYRGRKDSDVFKAGQISAKTPIDSWLRSQPRWFIESTLGKTKAALFMDGNFSLSKFTDATLNPINIDGLRRIDAAAFERAGL